MINTRAYLQMKDRATAEWASKCLREHERIVTLKNWAPGKSVDEFGQSEQLNTSPIVLPDELLDLPVCNERNGLHGYYDSSDYQAAWKLAMPASHWLPQLQARGPVAPTFIRRGGKLECFSRK